MNGQRQNAYAPRRNLRLNIDGTPVNSKFFKGRSEGPETASKTERLKGKGSKG